MTSQDTEDQASTPQYRVRKYARAMHRATCVEGIYPAECPFDGNLAWNYWASAAITLADKEQAELRAEVARMESQIRGVAEGDGYTTQLGNALIVKCDTYGQTELHREAERTAEAWQDEVAGRKSAEREVYRLQEELAAIRNENEQLRAEVISSQTSRSRAAEAKIAAARKYADHLDGVADGRKSMIRSYYNQNRPDDALRVETNAWTLRNAATEIRTALALAGESNG